jgi:hypothetical protein
MDSRNPSLKQLTVNAGGSSASVTAGAFFFVLKISMGLPDNESPATT